jgi:hypothetical protein
MHVWTARLRQEVLSELCVRIESSHVSGLLARLFGRWPRWVSRSGPQQRGGFASHCMGRVFRIVGSTDRHLTQLLPPASRAIRSHEADLMTLAWSGDLVAVPLRGHGV